MLPQTTQTWTEDRHARCAYLAEIAPRLPPGWLRRLGVIMEPDPTDPREAEGVLNPAVARGPDGALYLLPRLVGPGNYSRIGLARVRQWTVVVAAACLAVAVAWIVWQLRSAPAKAA